MARRCSDCNACWPTIVVETHLDDAPPLIFADPVLLEQLLFNLLENAAKYTPTGSRIVVSAQRGDDEVELTVVDNGPGFPPGVEPEALFEKFQRGRIEGSIGGVGLGLAICRAIARAHGGDDSCRAGRRTAAHGSSPDCRCPRMRPKCRARRRTE